jgi:hypothetical protein
MRPQLKGAIIGWLLAFAIGALAALAMRSLGLINAWVAVAIAIPTTALGVLIPVLRDTGILETPLGKSFLAAGAVAEIGPIIAMSLALSTAHSAPVQTAFTVAFLFIVALVGLGMLQARTPAILSVLSRTMTQSSQLPIRLGVRWSASRCWPRSSALTSPSAPLPPACCSASPRAASTCTRCTPSSTQSASASWCRFSLSPAA